MGLPGYGSRSEPSYLKGRSLEHTKLKKHPY